MSTTGQATCSTTSRITQAMDEARALIAKAVGLSPDELPYAAELMDVCESDVLSDAQGLNVRLSTSGSITFFYRYVPGVFTSYTLELEEAF